MIRWLSFLPIESVFFNQLLDFFFVTVEGEEEAVGGIELDGDVACTYPSIESTFEN